MGAAPDVNSSALSHPFSLASFLAITKLVFVDRSTGCRHGGFDLDGGVDLPLIPETVPRCEVTAVFYSPLRSVRARPVTSFTERCAEWRDEVSLGVALQPP
jgi:hypothetical protein